jgi:transcriptional regulator with XRE-family HTH domain
MDERTMPGDGQASDGSRGRTPYRAGPRRAVTKGRRRATLGGAMAESHVEPFQVRRDLSDFATHHLLFERFPGALKGLMVERGLSYRQLAYKTRLSAGYLNHLTKGTRPVPADPVIRTIAAALHVEPDFFLEYRLRRVVGFLEGSDRLIDALYSILLLRAPVSEEMKRVLEGSSPGTSSGPETQVTPNR